MYILDVIINNEYKPYQLFIIRRITYFIFSYKGLIFVFQVHKFKILFLISIVLLIIMLHMKPIYNFFYFTFYDKNDLRVYLSLVNSQVHTVSSESSNKVYLKAEVKNKNGVSIPYAKIDFSIDDNLGMVFPKNASTNKFGESIVTYVPPNYYELDPDRKNSSVIVTARINKTSKDYSVKFDLMPVPVIFVHGYQENVDMFDNMSDYLSSKGYSCSALSYDSRAGVIPGSRDLQSFMQLKKSEFLNKGMLVNKFTLITHSMGGLVTRYYSSSEEYLKNNDINKIIFLSVPHRGSHLASIGENFFNDQSIRDLIPDSELFTNSFHDMINDGLNNSIQIGNILSQYDEVVTVESAGLEHWNIKTEIFNIGENNFTVDNLLNGNILEAPNHKGILNNKRVFERIYEMLNVDLPYPAVVSN